MLPRAFLVFSKLFLMSLLISSHCLASTVRWTGGSGSWDSASHWDSGSVPTATSDVVLSLAYNEIVYVKSSVNISEFSMYGGTLELGNNVTLGISDAFYFNHGTLKGADLSNKTSVYAAIEVRGSAVFGGAGVKHFRNLNFKQAQDTLTWNGGELVLFNSTISVSKNSQFSIDYSSSNSTTLRMKTDVARYNFDYYSSQELNANVNLINTVTPGDAVYDIVTRGTVRISTLASASGLEIYPLGVAYDTAATEFYALHVPDSEFGYRYSLYNRTVQYIDEDQCAFLCKSVYEWCLSFDYHFYNQTCQLSRFKKSQVGGLTAKLDVVSNHSYPVSHYERRTYQRGIDSYLKVEGALDVTGGHSDADIVFIDVICLLNGGVLTLNSGVNVTFSQQTVLDNSARVNVSADSSLLFSGLNSSLTLHESAVITGSYGFARASNGLNISSGVTFENDGSHYLYGTLNGSIALSVGTGAMVKWWAVNNSASSYSWTDVTSTTLTLHSLTIENNGYLTIEGISKNTLSVVDVQLTNNGTLSAAHLNIQASNHVHLDGTSSITAKGRGYGRGSGPAAGVGHFSGSSGGAHGGRGGPAKVDANGTVYGALVLPVLPGSGGGSLHSSGSSGGGVLQISALSIVVDGAIDCSGSAGVSGGGGGAGGSLILSASRSLSGSGYLSVAGGDGGNSGGVISGGGGGGGRMSLTVAIADALSFNGTYDVSGGYRSPTYDVSGAEQAGPGTAYIASASTFYAVLASNQNVSNYLDNLKTRTPLEDATLDSSLDDFRFRGAYLLEGTSDLPSAAQCNLDIHLVGSAPLVLNGDSFCLHRMIGSGSSAQVHAKNGVALTFDQSVLHLQTVALHAMDCSFSRVVNATVWNGGSLHLYDFDTVDGGELNAGEGLYQLDRLILQSEGQLVAHNSSIILNMTNIQAESGSTVQVHGTLTFGNGSSVTFSGCTLRKADIDGWPLSSQPTLALAPYSIALFSGDVILSDLVLTMQGDTTFDGDFSVTKSLWLDSVSQLVIQTSASVATGSNVTWEVDVALHDTLTVPVGALLSLSLGGTFKTSSYVDVTGSLWIRNGTVLMEEGCTMNGQISAVIVGSIHLGDQGILVPSSSVAAVSPVIRVAAEGLMDYYTRSDASSFVIASPIVVESGGLMRVRDCDVTVSDLSSSGTIRLNNQSAALNLVTTTILSGGLVAGNGTITVESAASLHLSLPSVTSLGQDDIFLTVLGVTVVNQGHLYTHNGTVNFAQAAEVFNYGSLVAMSNQIWTHSEQLYAFNSPNLCSITLDPSGGVMHYNLTAEECAFKCVHDKVTVASVLGEQDVMNFEYECKAFLYNSFLSSCQVQTSVLNSYHTCGSQLANNTVWQLYSKVSAWAQEPHFYNTPSGELIASNSGGTFDIPMTNEGSINSTVGTVLIFSGGFNQTSAGSLTAAGGEITIEESNYNYVAGVIAGAGNVVLGAGNGSLSETILNGTTIIASKLTLTVSGSVKASRISSMRLSALKIDGGSLLLVDTPLNLTASNVSINAGGSFSSASEVVTTDLGCVGCYDVDIHSDEMSLTSASSLNFSYAFLSSTTVSVDSTSSILCTGRGYTPTSRGNRVAWSGLNHFLGSSGGSHGGAGGQGYQRSVPVDTRNFDRSYGHFYDALNWGAPGGFWNNDTNSDESAGGGSIRLHADTLQLWGTIACDGNSPSDSLAGGGAGGSLRITAVTLSGSGTISASGGVGGTLTEDKIGEGGGGGGGRISVFVNDYSGFSGSYEAFGGVGYQKGSAGSVYLTNKDDTSSGQKLIYANFIDGEGATTELYSNLNEHSPYGPLASLHVTSGSRLSVTNSDPLVVDKLLGDFTGTILLSNSSVLTSSGVFDESVNTTVAGVLSLEAVTLTVADALLNVSKVLLQNGGELRLSPSGASSSLYSGEYELSDLHIESGGSLVMDYHSFVQNTSDVPTPIKLNVSNHLWIEAGGAVKSNAQGHQGTYRLTSASANATGLFAPGAGSGSYGQLGGGGAAYGGAGGAGVSGSAGVHYGSITEPLDFGSGGGGSYHGIVGGNGGGVVQITAYNMTVDGVISANGGVGTGAGAGGGSGGSVLLRSTYITGAGSIQAMGGDGLYSSTYFGGSGAGGRIVIECTNCYVGGTSFTYNGNVTAMGGWYSYVTYPDISLQDPIWRDFGTTSINWLAESPTRAAGGTSLWVTGDASGSQQKLLFVENYPSTSVSVPYQSSTLGYVSQQSSLSKGLTHVNISVVDYLVLSSYASVILEPSVYLAVTSNIYSDGSTELTVSPSSTLWVPQTVEWNSVLVRLEGELAGANDLTLNSSSSLILYPNASWVSSISSYSTVAAAVPVQQYSGVFNTTTVVLDDGSGLFFFGADAYADQRVVLKLDELVLLSSDSYISADGYGYENAAPGKTTQSRDTYQHPDFKASGNISYGDGGWHAGRGGGLFYTYAAYGSAFEPITWGAAGGSTWQASGGSGGGAIHIIAEDSIVVNGKISANGDSCHTTAVIDSYAGGGAGGSIWLTVNNGQFSGTGELQAQGGNGCPNGGGAGSGGRVAVYSASGDLTHFTGSINVHSGTQNLTTNYLNTVPIDPAGGTIFVADSDGQNGVVLANNAGRGGGDVYLYNDCSNIVNAAKIELTAIYMGDSDLVVDHGCTVILQEGVYQYSDSSLFRTTTAIDSGVSTPDLLVSNGSLLVVLDALVLDSVNVVIYDHSTLLLAENMTLQNSSDLSLATQYSRVLGASPSLIANASSYGRLPAFVEDLYQSPTYSTNSMSYVYLNKLTIDALASLTFLSQSDNVITESNYIVTNSLTVRQYGHIYGQETLLNPELTFSTDDTIALTHSSYGKPSSTGYAASGGGHAGNGTTGTNNPTTGMAFGDALKPLGPGGPGGADMTVQVIGGGGGSGLYFLFRDSFMLYGQIDVSGGTGTYSAGGGAGGSVYIESESGIFRGQGQITANGGNGTISRQSAYHGGAGSGGMVAINVCVDNFVGTIAALGGLSMGFPEWMPSRVSVELYQKYSSFNVSYGGYQSLQEVVAATSGSVARSSYFYSTGANTVSSSEKAICQARWSAGLPSFSNVTSLTIDSWDASSLYIDDSTMVADMVKSLKLSDVTQIPFIRNLPFELYFPLPVTELSSVYVNTLSLFNTELKFTGNGTITSNVLDCNGGTTVLLEESTEFNPVGTLNIHNFTMNMTGESKIKYGVNLDIAHGGRLIMSHANQSSDFAYNSNVDRDPESLHHNLTFNRITMTNGAGIYGSKIIINAQYITMHDNSTISADGKGMYGGMYQSTRGSVQSGTTVYSVDRTVGSGIGGGDFGETGGCGGGHGGYGAPGINALYRSINADQYLGLTGDTITLNDAKLGISFNNGTTYGDVFAPLDYGGGGGATLNPMTHGGRGGGIIVLFVREDIYLDATSTISADGESIFNGGGAGAGGSIWLRRGHGHVQGHGSITARGGKTCPTDGCTIDIDYPGGMGGGGRIRIDKAMEQFTGLVSAVHGHQNHSTDVWLTRRMGTYSRVLAISTMVLTSTSSGQEAIDIIFTQLPLRMVQTITTGGTGSGNRSATDEADAVIRGTWTLGYRNKFAKSYLLSSQATASEVKEALTSMDHSDLNDITVTRKPSSANGWIWSITFFDYVDRVVPIKVNGGLLWCTDNNANITVEVVNPYNTTTVVEDVRSSDAPCTYNYTQLDSMMTFSQTILNSQSYGYWLNIRTLRLVPQFSQNSQYFAGLLENLQLKSIKPVPTTLGFISSLEYPYLLDTYEPNWKFPTSLPSSMPSDQPSGNPTEQPTSSPTGQPTTVPSVQPSSQPTSSPTMQPSVQPSSLPTCQPTSHPSMQPSMQPTSSPSGQPTGHPSTQPSVQPSSRPSSQPSSQPSAQPSRQPTAQPSRQPTRQPTAQPSRQPTSQPSRQPSRQPTSQPTLQPFMKPSSKPTQQPTSHPSMQPSVQPSSQPTLQPFMKPSSKPTQQPSSHPSHQPTVQPSMHPSGQPSSHPSRQPSVQPSVDPSGQPSMHPTMQPTCQPTSNPTQPTGQPSSNPSGPSSQPTANPSTQPTSQPSMEPSTQPTGSPSTQPSSQPSGSPTTQPSAQPSGFPSTQPTLQPFMKPTGMPSGQPSARPSLQPSGHPTTQPSAHPSAWPSSQPSGRPSTQPTLQPFMKPTGMPSGQPSARPSLQPSGHPTTQPSAHPSAWPSSQPSGRPSTQPSEVPSSRPSAQPTDQPSSQPIDQPTSQPSGLPSIQPSGHPSGQPTISPTSQPSNQPASTPSVRPTAQPSGPPSLQPSGMPSGMPSAQPVLKPTSYPSTQPSGRPSMQPTGMPSSIPTFQPTERPSTPTGQPTGHPSLDPTGQPSAHPSHQPTSRPSQRPGGTPTAQPSGLPTQQPFSHPSSLPSSQPVGVPSSQPAAVPSSLPSQQPASDPTSVPSSQPVSHPSAVPSSVPLADPTSQPSGSPTVQPSGVPSNIPSVDPSAQPSGSPTVQPSAFPSSCPSARPSDNPTTQPSGSPSSQPSAAPSSQPLADPTSQPSGSPTVQPSGRPTLRPSSQPTSQPSAEPSVQPSSQPRDQPTGSPTVQPSSDPSSLPTLKPASQPTAQPSVQPTTQPSASPTDQPSSQPSSQPSGLPSSQPSCAPSCQPLADPTSQPSGSPTVQPSSRPTLRPSSQPSSQPSAEPSVQPSSQPSDQPSGSPTVQPSGHPSAVPSVQPISEPSAQPSGEPSTQPSSQPSGSPTNQPSNQPSVKPTSRPSPKPTPLPTFQPTRLPTIAPTITPTVTPTVQPSIEPSIAPTVVPTMAPSILPTIHPSVLPTIMPTVSPTVMPTVEPSIEPSIAPSIKPTVIPTLQPTVQPTVLPSIEPSVLPTVQPSIAPTVKPTIHPSLIPTEMPSIAPSQIPTVEPSIHPTVLPTVVPTTTQPTVVPSIQPTVVPTVEPSIAPTLLPTVLPTTTAPTVTPTVQPSIAPTVVPTTTQPTIEPSIHPTVLPSVEPSIAPSLLPTVVPTTTAPTVAPSIVPTVLPTVVPTTTQPTESPSIAPTFVPTVEPSIAPTVIPTVVPTTTAPTVIPTTTLPTIAPSIQPTVIPSVEPSTTPSLLPTALPTTTQPTVEPTTTQPTIAPTIAPTMLPTVVPTTTQPTVEPTTTQPTIAPTIAPTALPTVVPTTTQPTVEPTTTQPSIAPTIAPTLLPTAVPTTTQPTVEPTTTQPTIAPTIAPTVLPTVLPTTTQPTVEPTTTQPSIAPTIAPTVLPTVVPTTTMPTVEPTTTQPTISPTIAPTLLPTVVPTTTTPTVEPTTSQPTVAPTIAPTVLPTVVPTTTMPTAEPTTTQPTIVPTITPTQLPTVVPTTTSPTVEPTTIQPTVAPTVSEQPTVIPTEEPTAVPT